MPDFSNRTAILLAAALLVGTGCDNNPETDAGVDSGPPPMGDGGGTDAGDTDAGTSPGAVLRNPSRSSAIAVSDDDAIVAMVNPEDGSLSTFTTVDNERLARIPTGAHPSSVVLHPNGTTAFVANRGDATVVRIDGIDGSSPTVSATVEVGSEPTGLALSPSGARLFVAEHAEGSIGVIDTATMTRTDSIDAPQNPYALAITNNGDDDDTDELLIAPEFFGVPTAAGEGRDGSRQGLVRVYRLSDLAPDGPITLAPVDSGFIPAGGTTSVLTSPNQLSSVSIQAGRAYITSISAAPAGPVRFDVNVHPVLYVADIESRTEIRDGGGSVNLAALVRDGTAPSKLFLADTIDLAFIGDTGGIAYAASRGADAVQRVVFDPAGASVSIGSTRNLQIDVNAAPAGAPAGCQSPIGIATANDAPRAYLNCWLTRRLGVIDLSMQSLTTTVESTSPSTDAAQVEIARGRRFFHTGRARWSNNSWSTCASCHPGGLTDNMTWQFAAGPRQTTSLDGTYSHGDGPQQERVLNWTAIFDELHDFERNTRGVSGGVGAVTNGDCSALTTETRVDPLPGGLGQPIKELADLADNCTDGDWDAIDAWVRTVEPPRARRFADADAVSRGAVLFGMPSGSANNGGCVACHGGPGWTASRRFFTPSSATNASLASTVFAPPAAWAPGWNLHTFQIEAQPAAADTTGSPVGPPQVACVLRDVGTFGLPGDATGTTALEVRDSGARAQGAGGYNVPSLYGLATGAPYFHAGQAASLEELLTDARWDEHLRAGNPVFLTTGDVAQQRSDLIEFLLSIDASTTEQAIPAAFEGCAAP